MTQSCAYTEQELHAGHRHDHMADARQERAILIVFCWQPLSGENGLWPL